MKIPILYNVRSVMQRPVSTALTALGIALVVAVFIGMLALANGFRVALARTGVPENMLILRRGADSELSSGLPRDAVSIITASPHVAVGSDGRPLMSPEVFVLIPLPRPGPDSNAVANVVARGVSDRVWEVRANVRVTAGQRPAPGRAEICVGEKLVTRFEHTGLGDTLRFANRTWPVVCHFSAAGSSFESEIWGENEQFMAVFRGDVFQVAAFRLADPSAWAEAERSLEDDRRITVDAYRESEFYASQSALLGSILEVLAVMITSIMAVGAVFGAVNTMYAAVAARRAEIAVLLTLGFQPRSVLASFLVESAIVAALGGVVGCVLALPINGLVAGTTNWASFAEIAFGFRVTPGLLGAGMVFAVVMGVVGGFFPARQAARARVVDAIR
jgi:hypothetical protein